MTNSEKAQRLYHRIWALQVRLKELSDKASKLKFDVSGTTGMLPDGEDLEMIMAQMERMIKAYHAGVWEDASPKAERREAKGEEM